jgi:ERCC4-type nuclease
VPEIPEPTDRDDATPAPAKKAAAKKAAAKKAAAKKATAKKATAKKATAKKATAKKAAAKKAAAKKAAAKKATAKQATAETTTGAEATASAPRSPAELLSIRGLGPGKRAKLMEQFGSVEAIADADVADLAALPGIGRGLAQAIHDTLN